MAKAPARKTPQKRKQKNTVSGLKKQNGRQQILDTAPNFRLQQPALLY